MSTLTFDQFNASLMNKSINLFIKNDPKLLNDSLCISINAVKRVITSKIKAFVCIIYVYIYYVYTNTHTCSIYFENISKYFHVYIYIHIIYIINKYI